MYQDRAHQPHSDVAQSLNVNPYAHYTPLHDSQQQYVQSQPRSHQTSQQIVGEDGSRPSLPSISNLLGIAADGERSSSEARE
jgi:hypothetical protein